MLATMSSTWTCTCGKTFDVSERQAGNLVKCPWCEFVFGEALPETFESPTAIQAEEPTPHIALADPEVAVTAAEPKPRRMQSGASDATDIDIRLPSRPVMLVYCVIFAFGIGSLLLKGYFWLQPEGASNKDTAHAQAKVLTNACNAYKLMHNQFPKSLDTLLEKDEFGKNYVDDPNGIIDPWRKPYQYDANGPRNNGERPDIWTVAPDGQEIGNWTRKQ